MIERPHLLRLKPVAALCLIPFALVVPRLAWLQLVEDDSLDRKAELQNMRRIWVPPKRGEILDRTGKRLAFSVPDTSRGAARTRPAPPMKRLYPYGASAAQVVGYVNRDGSGEAGIELELERELEGHPGWATELRDGAGKAYVFPDRPGKLRSAGCTVQLTLDAQLQEAAMNRLEAHAKRLRAKSATLVAVDPRSGEVLAMASWPSFEPERYHESKLRDRLNRAVTMPIEPGSTFKLIPAVTALEENLFSLNTKIHCENGEFRRGGRLFTDHKPLGLLTFRECFAQSSNIAFAKVGEICSFSLYDTARRFRFGSATGVGLPGEANGRVPHPEAWSGYTASSVAIGYEVLVTPLQLAMAYAAVANDGLLLRPYLIDAIRDADGRVVFTSKTEAVGEALGTGLCRLLRQCMREVVTEGTGKNAELDWTLVGGKTGTTRKLVGGKYSRKHHFASFVGIAPLDDPRIVVTVVLDEPQTEIYGGSAAAPIFRDVLETYRRMPGAVLAPDYPVVGLPTESLWDHLRRLGGRPAFADEPDPGTGGWMAGLPDMRGMTVKQALRWCEVSGVTPQVRGSGIVTEQNPAPGSTGVGVVGLVCEAPKPIRLALSGRETSAP